MAALEVDYEGVTIISTDAAGTKTLQTAGKYLDDDISINFAGGSGEIEGKQWIKNVTATLTSGSWAVLTGEQFIADNYNNSRLCVFTSSRQQFRFWNCCGYYFNYWI